GRVIVGGGGFFDALVEAGDAGGEGLELFDEGSNEFGGGIENEARRAGLIADFEVFELLAELLGELAQSAFSSEEGAPAFAVIGWLFARSFLRVSDGDRFVDCGFALPFGLT
ncbi:hypothetical protein JIN78_16925, partial [Roseibacillus ishigakijimensis]